MLNIIFRYIFENIQLYNNLIYMFMLQELLLEHADFFYHFKSIAPTGTITQEDIREIINELKLDSR